MSSANKEKLYLQGRAITSTLEKAKRNAKIQISKKGCRPVGEIKVFKAPVQPYKDKIWWEWQAEVEEMPSELASPGGVYYYYYAWGYYAAAMRGEIPRRLNRRLVRKYLEGRSNAQDGTIEKVVEKVCEFLEETACRG